MIKLTHLIVDQNYRLIGFTGEGKAKDFGEFTNDKITRPITLKFMFDSGFSNKQITAKRGTLLEHEGFKLNTLPMLMLTDSGYVNIDNTIKLTKRYVQNNENIGFEVLIGNSYTSKFTYADTINMCNLFKPVNFVIRYNKDKKRFIAGKSGASLSDLPVEVVGSTTNAKRTKPTTQEASKGISAEATHEIDIMEIYTFIRNVNGFIINLPGTEYKATTQSAAVGEQFVPFNIGEVGVPYLDFNETKFNVNCNFKKPGAVALELKPNKKSNVITFVYRKKNVFFNGDNYINKLGVVIPANMESELLSRFGKSMSLTEITDPGMIQPMSMLIGRQGLKFYEMDTSKIGIIAKSKLDKYILNVKDIYARVLVLSQNKFIVKYLNGLMKELRSVGDITESSKLRDIAPQFAAMSNDELEVLINSGIDIYSGAYTVRNESSKTSGVDTSNTVEVAYAIEGLNPSSLTYKQMITASDKVPPFLGAVIAEMNSIEDLGERASKASKYLEEYEKINGEIKRELWMHKCAMYLKSNKTSIHSHDKRYWEINTKKRTKAKCYNCKIKGCESLQLLVSNIDIK